MSDKVFIKAEEIADELGVSKPYAYKLVRQMNDELEQRGFITIAGRVSRKYYQEKIYGTEKKKREIDNDRYQR